MITRNGKAGAGWRLDEMTEDGPMGMEFVMHPFAIVPDAANADRIVEAFRLLEEWRKTPQIDVECFAAKVDAVLNPKV